MEKAGDQVVARRVVRQYGERVRGTVSALLGLTFLAAALCALAPRPASAFEATLSAPGAPSELVKKLEGSSSLIGAETSGIDTAQEYFAAALADYRTLLQVLYDAGYFGPVISIKLDGREAADIPLISPPTRINNVAIRIDTGPPFRFRTAQVTPLAPDTELPKGFAPGEPASTGLIREAAIAGRDGWRREGYAKAALGQQRITALNQSAQIDAQLELIPGRQLRFGKLNVTGQSAVRMASIQRIAGMPTGQVTSPEEAQKVAARLRRTGAFKSVSMTEAAVANPDGTLDYNVAIADAPKRRISFGVEVATTTGANVSAVWIHRNLFGNAERLRLEAEINNIGGDLDIDGGLGFRLEDPTKLGADNLLYYTGSIRRIEAEHYSMNQLMLGVGVRRTISDELFFEASLEPTAARADDAYGTKRPFDYIALPIHAELDRRDLAEDPRQGYYLDVKLTPFLGVSGTASGMQAYADGRGYYTLGNRAVLAGRLQLGSVVGVAADQTAPNLLFFSGGAGTVRGQPYQSLGVPIGTGIAGGRSILAASAEVRTLVTDSLQIVGFYDFGAVDSASFVSSSSPTQAGAGIGVRYTAGGFGPIRFDLAWPVSGSTGDGIQFYLGIGQAF